MFPVLLWIMPILMAVAVVIYVERVRKVNVNEQNDKRCRAIFDGVALTLEAQISHGNMSEYVAQRVLETLINELTDISFDFPSWNTPDEALRDNLDTPWIVQAFDNCGIKLVKE